MIITLIILCIVSFSLWGYSLHQTKKLDKEITNLKNIISSSIKSQVTENKLYLLDEIDNKSSSNLDYLYKEIEKIKKEKQDEFKIYIEGLIKTKYSENKSFLTKNFDEVSKNIDIKHLQLVSGEMKKLRSELNKDLNNIVESIKNTKVF